ncbi:MAG: cell division protein ZipA [Pseudomonadota bacterium]
MPELTLRDWMVVIGSLLILAVIVDAWRRMRQQQRSHIRMKLAEPPSEDGRSDDIASFRELPNGGARVIKRMGSGGDEVHSPSDQDRATDASATVATARTAIEVGSSEAANPGLADAPSPSLNTPSANEAADSVDSESGSFETTTQSKAESQASDRTQLADELGGEPLAGVSAIDEPSNLDWLEDLPRPSLDVKDEAGELPRSTESEVVVLHVVSRSDKGFAGADILEILLACDLRFGDMSFFHRHEHEAGRGAIQFSVANMLKPGVFAIDNMDELRTQGLVFFLTLPGPEDMVKAFDYMLETARVVAKNLDGDVLDGSRSVLTQQAVEHSKQQIRELERRVLAQAP